VKRFKINLAIAIIITQFIGHAFPVFSMTLNRKEIDNLEISIWKNQESFPSIDNSLDEKSWLNSSKILEISLVQSLSNNCFESLYCQQQKGGEKSTSVFKLDLIESFKAFKLNSDNSDSSGIGYVPILAKTESGDIYKGVYDYELNIDRDYHDNSLVLSTANESLKFFVNPKNNFYSNTKKANSNNFKIALAFKYDSLGEIKTLSKGKTTKTPKATNKIASLKILPSNYSSLKIRVNNSLIKSKIENFKNPTIAKVLPEYRVSYSVTDRYQSLEPLWQQQIDRKLSFKRQQLDDRQRQFRIKIEQNLEQSNREQQRQDLMKQQQQQLQPIRNYY
jgi:hypothetical protein